MVRLSKREQIRLIRGIGRALASGADLDDAALHTALCDILVREQWPAPAIVTACALDRRRMGRTTDPGGIDGPPYDRPLAENTDAVNPEAGARQGSDDDLGIPPERYEPG